MSVVASSRQGRVMTWLHGHDGAPWGTDPGAFDPDAVRESLGRVGRLFGPGRYFRLRTTGVWRIPEEPVLLVGNHSGGTSIPDLWGLVATWYRAKGVNRPLHALAHELVFSLRGVGEYMARRGVLRADPHVALAALRDHGHDLLILPGGDRDTWRPYRDRYRVRFFGRKGYARLALQSGTPVVPVAHAGSHDTLVVLTDGGGIARRLRLPELARAEIFPIHLSLPFGLTVGPLPHLPPPTLLRYRFGAPVAPPRRIADPMPADVDAFDARVRRSLQRELDALASERVTPLERAADAARAAIEHLRTASRTSTP